LEEKKDFLKKLGSNFQILNQKLVFDFKNPLKSWQKPSPAAGGARRKTRRV
jgi:hypothetical protein